MVSVGTATLTVRASSQSTVYGQAPADVIPTYSGFANGDTAPATAPTCTTTATAASPVGTYPTTCTGAADPNYTITYVNGQITVARAAQTITVTTAPPATVTIGRRFTVAATTSAGLRPTFASSGASCTLVDRGNGTATVTAVAAGTCTVVVRQSGDTRYTPAARVTLSVPVRKIAQAVTVTSTPPTGDNAQVGDTATVTATGGASGNPVVFSSTAPRICSVVDDGDGAGTVTLLRAGTCRIAADQAGNATYADAPQARQAFVVTAAADR